MPISNIQSKNFLSNTNALGAAANQSPLNNSASNNNIIKNNNNNNNMRFDESSASFINTNNFKNLNIDSSEKLMMVGGVENNVGMNV